MSANSAAAAMSLGAFYDRPSTTRLFTPRALLAASVVALGFFGVGELVTHQQFRAVLFDSPEPEVIVKVQTYDPPPPPPPPQPVEQTRSPPPQPVFHDQLFDAPPPDPAPLPTIEDPPLNDGPVVLASAQPTPVPTPVAPPAAPDPVIRHPDWAAKPTARQMASFFPDRARKLHVSGQVLVRCAVGASGALNHCAVAREDPASMGFGAAALKLTTYFRLKPATRDGQTIDGARVEIPLSFSLSG